MIEQKLNPSLIVERTIPDYVVEEFPKFVSFIRAYYKFLEQDDQTIGRLNKFLSNMDIHTVTDSDAQYRILSMFMESIPKNLEIDYALLVQNIRKFYSSKGSEGSIKTFLYLMSEARKPNSITVAYSGDVDSLVGQAIAGTSSGAIATIIRATRVSGSSQYVVAQVSYTSSKKFFISSDQVKLDSGEKLDVYVEDFNVELFYPKNYLLRSSDGIYTSQKRCRILVTPTQMLKTTFANLSFITSSGNKGRIDRASYSVGVVNGYEVMDLVLSFSTFKGWNASSETITIDGTIYPLTPVLLGATVDLGGLGYSDGDSFPILKDGSPVANLVVERVGRGRITSILVHSGGTGYSVGDKFKLVYSDGEYGGGYVSVANSGVIVQAKIYHSRKNSPEYPTIVFESGNSTATLYPVGAGVGAIESVYVDSVHFDIDGSETVEFSDTLDYLQKANVTLKRGSLYTTRKSFEDDRGQPSSSYRIQDSNYWQDFSYVLKINKSLDFDEISDLYKKVVHPAGTKVFLEYQKIPSKVSVDLKMNYSSDVHFLTEHRTFDDLRLDGEDVIPANGYIKDTNHFHYFCLPFYIRENAKTIVWAESLRFEGFSMTLADLNKVIHKYNNVVECYPFEITIGS